MGGLPASSASRLYRLGAVHGQPSILKNNAARYSAKRTAGPRVKAARCCKGSRCVDAVVSTHWNIPGVKASIRFTAVAQTTTLTVCRNAKVFARCRSMLLSETLLLDALTPDRIAIAVCALGELESETTQLEKQWAFERDATRYTMPNEHAVNMMQ